MITNSKAVPEHNYKVIIEGLDAPLFFVNKQIAIETVDKCKLSGTNAWIMLKLADGVYVPLAD